MLVHPLLVFERRWLRRLQSTLAVDEASTHMEVLHSDDDKIVELLRLLLSLVELNAICRPAVDINWEGVPVQEAVPTQEVSLGLI
jgi:hypothetical protein